MADISNFDLSSITAAAMPRVGLSDLAIAKMANIEIPNRAKYAVEAIYKEIVDFEANLDDDHEVGMPVVGGPAGLCVHVREIYRYGDDKLVFSGVDGSQNPVRLIQHLSQLNLLMLSAPKLGEIAARIGFHEPNSD